jgi:hypothetical protein
VPEAAGGVALGEAGSAERDAAREEAKALAVRAAVAETDAKGLRERAERAEDEVAALRRPFWRRWLG